MASLVTVASFRDALDAEAARTALEAEGVECYLADQQIVGMNWNYSQAVGGVKLRVWDEADGWGYQHHSGDAPAHLVSSLSVVR